MSSEQYVLLKALIEDKKELMEAAVMKEADGTLEWCAQSGQPVIIDDQFWLYELQGTDYDQLTSKIGNADDEINLLANFWIWTLAKTGDAKYFPIIQNLAETQIWGL